MIKRTKQKGFTLIEILVAVATLTTIILVGAKMFFTILKGAAKTQALVRVKQNGNYALRVMTRMIRNAREVVSCDSNYLEIRNSDQQKTTFRFYGEPDYLIASESAGLTGAAARLTNNEVKLTNGVFSCSGGGTQPDKIVITFSLAQAEGTRPEEQASANFQTTVILRNY